MPDEQNSREYVSVLQMKKGQFSHKGKKLKKKKNFLNCWKGKGISIMA